MRAQAPRRSEELLAELASIDGLECHKQDIGAQGPGLVPTLVSSQNPAVVCELIRLIVWLHLSRCVRVGNTVVADQDSPR